MRLPGCAATRLYGNPAMRLPAGYAATRLCGNPVRRPGYAITRLCCDPAEPPVLQPGGAATLLCSGPAVRRPGCATTLPLCGGPAAATQSICAIAHTLIGLKRIMGLLGSLTRMPGTVTQT